MLIPTLAGAQILPQNNSARSPYAIQLKAERPTIKTNCDTNQAIRATIKEKYS